MNKKNTRLENPLLFLHISKTAGSAVKSGLKKTFSDYSFSDVIFDQELRAERKQEKYDCYASHVGFDVAEMMNAEVITLLRDPIERIVSLYNFWHNRIPKKDPGGVFDLVGGMNPEQFFKSNDMRILQGRQNCQTFQLALSHTKQGRTDLESKTDKEILDMALENLEKCQLVGFVEHMDKFSEKFENIYGKSLNIPKVNVSQKTDVSFIYDSDIRPLVFESIYLDILLYQSAIKKYL